MSQPVDVPAPEALRAEELATYQRHLARLDVEAHPDPPTDEALSRTVIMHPEAAFAAIADLAGSRELLIGKTTSGDDIWLPVAQVLQVTLEYMKTLRARTRSLAAASQAPAPRREPTWRVTAKKTFARGDRGELLSVVEEAPLTQRIVHRDRDGRIATIVDVLVED